MTKVALRLWMSLACGTLFGFGLALSGMLDPTRVRGFLDIFGHWDPSLMFVLAGAVVTSFIGVRLARHRSSPVLETRYDPPANTMIDTPLIAGAAIFGIGWGLSGFCPGPAVASLALGLMPTFVFTFAMIVGMFLFKTGQALIARQRPSRCVYRKPYLSC